MEYQTTGWLSPKLKQLEADNARLREELATLQEALDLSLYNDPTIRQLQEELAAAQAVIEQMLACFEAAEVEGLAEALNNTTDERLKDLIYRRLMYVPTIPTNLDALHEARAQECERLANSAGDVFAKHWLLSEASCHRARKEGK